MTDAEIQQRVAAALDEHLPKAIADVYQKIAADKSAVMDREREDSDQQMQARAVHDDEEKQRKDKREGRLWKYLVTPLVVAAVGGSGAGIYQGTRVEGTVDKRVDHLETAIVGCPNNEPCTKKKKAKSVTGRVRKAERKIDRLGELHFQQLKVIVDQGEEQRLKLDTMSPEAKAIPKPESSKDAEGAVRAHEKLKREQWEKKNAADAAAKGDPFAGIE